MDEPVKTTSLILLSRNSQVASYPFERSPIMNSSVERYKPERSVLFVYQEYYIRKLLLFYSFLHQEICLQLYTKFHYLCCVFKEVYLRHLQVEVQGTLPMAISQGMGSCIAVWF